MRRVRVAAALFALLPAAARACPPEDPRLHVWAAGAEIVLADHEGVARVATDGRVLHREALVEGGEVALLGDGRTLLHLAPTDEQSPTPCRPARWHVTLVDTVAGGQRRIGTIPRGGRGVVLDELRGLDGGRLRVRYWHSNDDVLEEIVVGPGARSVSAREVTGPDTPADPEPPAAITITERVLRVRAADGRTRVTVRLSGTTPLRAALTSDGHLALASYTGSDPDWGTPTGRRLEVLALATGERRTLIGEGTVIAAVRGRARVSCGTSVNEPGSPLHVRRTPSRRGASAGTLAHGTDVTVAETRGSWARLSAPREGWVWAASLAARCRAE